MPQCNEQFDECDAQPLSSETWSVCLPFAGRIWADGNGVHGVKGTNPPPDGVYGKVVIANGCIIGVEEEDVPLYTGSPCAPLPGDCSSNTTGSSSLGPTSVSVNPGTGSGGCTCDLTPSSTSGNLFATDVAGRPLVRCYVQGGTGISVTGNGTLSNPYVVSTGGSGITVESIYMRSGNEAIKITGSGTRTDPFVITHKNGEATTVNGMVFDAQGHFTGTSGSGANKGVTAITGTDGITATTDNKTGIVTVGMSKPASDVLGVYAFGGYDVSVDNWGRIYSINRRTNLGGSHVVSCGDATLTIDALGNIISVEGGGEGGDEPIPEPTPTPTPSTGGGAVMVVWRNAAPSNPQASNTFRFATFAWPTDSALAGILFMNPGDREYAGSSAFWNDLRIYIDGANCERMTFRSPVLRDSDHSSSGISVAFTTDNAGVTFWLDATVMAGNHEVSVGMNNYALPKMTLMMWPVSIASGGDR